MPPGSMDKLRALRDELAAISDPFESWGQLQAWAARAKPFLRKHFPQDLRDFEALANPNFPLLPLTSGTSKSEYTRANRDVSGPIAKRAQQQLLALIDGLLDLADDLPASTPMRGTQGESTVTGVSPATTKSVFVVHGNNHAVRDAIVAYLTHEEKLTVRVMSAEEHRGRTLPEKFEEIAKECAFAVFILTMDDHLKDLKSGKECRRARQNVILEIGYFWGALGRRGTGAVLVENTPETELPSDIQGIAWIPITADLGDTKFRLRKELKATGLLTGP
jgi:predicted nucleotide-binding protein